MPLYGEVYYREDNEVENEKALFLCAMTSAETAYIDMPSNAVIIRVGMYYPTDGREPFGGIEALKACAKDYQETHKK